MSQLLIRNIPEKLRDWVRLEAEKQCVSQQELLLKILEEASENGVGNVFGEPDRKSQLESETGNDRFTFIDLFAGIGGMRLGLEAVGGQCVFTSEIDKFARRTYRAWFNQTPHGDITQIMDSDVPHHDMLVGGFPCQPFSIAGVSKKNSLGRAHGFKDPTSGTMFSHIVRLLRKSRPAMFLLENVKNLKSHDGGNTWRIIEKKLKNLGYRVFAKVIDAAHYVPQHRERIFIVGFDSDCFNDEIKFAFPRPPKKRPALRSILDSKPDPKYTLTDHLWDYLQRYAQKHREQGNGFGFGLIRDLDDQTRTLSARYFKDGSEILIHQEGRNPRRLSPGEAARLMGFPVPNELEIVVSDTQAYKQFGNSVVPAVITAIATEMLKTCHKHRIN